MQNSDRVWYIIESTSYNMDVIMWKQKEKKNVKYNNYYVDTRNKQTY